MLVEHIDKHLMGVRAAADNSPTPKDSPAPKLPSLTSAGVPFDCVLRQYDELVATGRALFLSPTDLVRRVLVKGKVKLPKKGRDSSASKR
eukprot:5459160-Prymnesium_polylepis.1